MQYFCQEAGLGNNTDGKEYPFYCQGAFLASPFVGETQFVDSTLVGQHLFWNRIPEHFNFIVGQHSFLQGFSGSQLVATVDQVDLAGEASQK